MNASKICAHCGKRIRSDTHTVAVGGFSATFHGDRRACRVAAHEYPEATWAPPERTGQMDMRVLGAALIGCDYIRWPWWLRWVPDRWLDSLNGEIAMRVGGAVERGLAFEETS